MLIGDINAKVNDKQVGSVVREWYENGVNGNGEDLVDMFIKKVFSWQTPFFYRKLSIDMHGGGEFEGKSRGIWQIVQQQIK